MVKKDLGEFMKKISRRKIAMGTSLVFATSLTLAGVQSQAAEVVTLQLEMASYTPDMAPYYADLVKRFEAKYPGIKVNVDNVAWPEIGQKVKTMIASGQSPDIVNNDEYSAEAAAGLLYRADEIVSPATLADIIPAFLTNSEFNGIAVAVPDLASAHAFGYNKKILKGAGVTKVPTTWAELVTAAKKVKAKYPDVYPIGLPLGPEEAMTELTIWGAQNGARLYDPKTKKYTLDSKEFLGALNFLKSLVDMGLTQPNPSKTNRTDGAWALFAKGKMAMVNIGAWTPVWLKDNGGAGIELGIAPFPHSPSTKEAGPTLGVQDYFKGYKANGHKEEIRKFLDFLFEPTNYQGFLKAAGGFIPATKSAGKIAEATDPVMAPFIKMLPKAFFYPGSVASWQPCKTSISTYTQTALANPKKALQNMQKKCDGFQAKG